MMNGNLAVANILDELVEAVAERLAKKLGPPAPVLALIYTTNKRGPHPPGKTKRWCRDWIKRIPGARRVGRDWEVPAAAYEAWASAKDAERVRQASSSAPRLPAPELESFDDAELA